MLRVNVQQECAQFLQLNEGDGRIIDKDATTSRLSYLTTYETALFGL